MSGEEQVVVEAGERLSRSRLWRWQRAFYVDAGPAAWSRGIVPHHVTSNPFIARVYAELLAAWLRDVVAGGVDRARPLHVVELGAGSGRLSFLLLLELRRALELPVFAGLRVVLVMTDFHPGALAAWRAHPQLAPFVADGSLDFAVLDVERDASIRLEVSGRTLAPDGAAGPLAVIANYVFDGLPCDLYRVVGGAIAATTVALRVPAGRAAEAGPGLLAAVELDFQQVDVDVAGEEPAVARLLAAYAREVADAELVIPVAAIRCVDALRRLTDGRLLILAADKGYHRIGDLLACGGPALARHGSVSMMVNFHALGLHARACGGELLGADHGHAGLDVCALRFGGEAPELRGAWRSRIDHQHPGDFHLLRGSLADERLTLAQVLAALRWSGWDPLTLLGLFTPLMRAIEGAGEVPRAEVAAAVREVWRRHFELGEAIDLAYVLGVVCMGLERPAEALEFFARSRGRGEPTVQLRFNEAVCEWALGRVDAARAAAQAALAVDPEHADARDLQRRLGAG